jgi:hypothetical protein
VIVVLNDRMLRIIIEPNPWIEREMGNHCAFTSIEGNKPGTRLAIGMEHPPFRLAVAGETRILASWRKQGPPTICRDARPTIIALYMRELLSNFIPPPLWILGDLLPIPTLRPLVMNLYDGRAVLVLPGLRLAFTRSRGPRMRGLR